MTRFGKKHLIVAANVAALAITVSIALNSRQAGAQGQGGPRVTIESPLPLPVTGNVGLASGTSVRVDNTVTDPVRVRNVNDAIQPFQAVGQCSNFSGGNTCGATI